MATAVPSRPLIAIDIDDVIADTHGTSRLWIEERAGVPADYEVYETHTDYWDYYNRVIMTHGDSPVRFEDFLGELVRDQSHMPLLAGAQFAIGELSKKYDIVLITARDPLLEPATRAWIDTHLGPEVPLHLSNNPLVGGPKKSKGELCRELGVSVLIDDNAANCRSALDHGVSAMLFGRYAWQVDIPETTVKVADWPTVLERIDDLIA
jgi:5'(3')-deoxyribonucleotidase